MTQIHKEKTSLFLEMNLKLIFLLTGALLLFGLGAVAFIQHKNKKEKEAGGVLYEHKRALLLEGKKVNGKEYGKNPFLPQSLLQKKDIIYSDEMKKLASKFEQAIRAYKKMRISVFFAMELADFYLKAGEKEKARSILKPFAIQKRLSTAYQLTRLQLASLYMDESLCEKALPFLKKSISKKKPGIFDTEIYLKKGICYEETNQEEQAKKAYQKVIKNNPDSLSASKAKDYLLTMKLKKAFAPIRPEKSDPYKGEAPKKPNQYKEIKNSSEQQIK